MAATAVGMFENATVAESVADSLRTTSRPPRSVQVFAGGSQTSAAAVLLYESAEQAGGLSRDESRIWAGSQTAPSWTAAAGERISEDLRLMGAGEPDIAIYLTGLRLGHAVVLATGTLAQADAASARMNRFGTIEIESRLGILPGAGSDEESAWNALRESEEGVSYPDFGIHRAECARLFCW